MVRTSGSGSDIARTAALTTTLRASSCAMSRWNGVWALGCGRADLGCKHRGWGLGWGGWCIGCSVSGFGFGGFLVSGFRYCVLCCLGWDRVRVRREGLQQPQRRHARRRQTAARVRACEREDRREVRVRRDGAESPRGYSDHLECGIAFGYAILRLRLCAILRLY